jgi:hypothetical protein
VADDPSAAKGGLRESFSFARQAHLAVPSTARFVAEMGRKGVDRLLADGPELAARLGKAVDNEIPLTAALSPSLELVEASARDAETGLRLMDIWRYMRLHWSIPYQSTPGRNLFYLVRDNAGPQRPVIGIAALGNAVLGLGARDRSLGLTAEALRERFHETGGDERQHLLDHLHGVLKEGFNSLFADDLPLAEDRGESPALALRAVEKQASRSRSAALRSAQSERTGDYDIVRDAHNRIARGEEVDWVAVARTDLYRRKRKRFVDAVGRAGLRHVRFHDLRHTFGTQMAAAGAPLRAIQEWMGHRDYRTTSIYADHAPDPSNGRRWAEAAFGESENSAKTGDFPADPIARFAPVPWTANSGS